MLDVRDINCIIYMLILTRHVTPLAIILWYEDKKIAPCSDLQRLEKNKNKAF